jgi:hypothetical protein
MTVTEIVQKLLDKGHITAEEAVILLKAEIDANKPVVTFPEQIYPTYPTYPTYPYSPTVSPNYPKFPEVWYQSGTAGNQINGPHTTYGPLDGPTGNSGGVGVTGQSGIVGTLNDNFTKK